METTILDTHKVVKDDLVLRAMGISNYAMNVITEKVYSLQFFDIDGSVDIPIKIIKQYLSFLFPYDCICYETKDGFHFLSFALLMGLNITKARSLRVVKEMGNQDYFSKRKELCLRVSPKWDSNYNEISPKPRFKQIVKKPVSDNLLISNSHLRFYERYMGLPKEVLELYSDCRKVETRIRINHYKTRD